MDYMIPSVRNGHYRMRIEFSGPTVEELILLLFCEFSQVLKISASGKVTTSY